jgi:uncharacterized membrane protein HdeD (DUF308 family)
MNAYWFRPKTYGYGATPNTWQGWAVIAAAVIVMVVAALLILPHRAQSPAALVVFLGVEAVVLAVLWVICRRKTDGEWRWRWGGH